MAIVYVPKFQEYVGLSTDNKAEITTEASIIYYSDTKKRQILHGGVWGDYVLNTDAILNTSDLQIGAVEIKNSTDDTRAKVGQDGLHVDVRNVPQSFTTHDAGSATSGTKTTLTDTAKNYSVNANVGKSIHMTINGVTYIRSISSNTVNTQTFTPALPGASASAVVGDIAVAQTTVVYDAEGTGGNTFSIEIVDGVGNNVPLSAALNGTTVTVTLATDGAGLPDNAANTEALVTAVIDALAGFSATATGAAGVMVTTVAPVVFTGGIDTVMPLATSEYKIIELENQRVDVTFHNQATVAADGNSFVVGDYKNLIVEIYGTSANRSIDFKGTLKSGAATAIQGIKLSDFTLATGTTGQSEVWSFDVTGLSTVIMDVTAVAGGYVSVLGVASL